MFMSILERFKKGFNLTPDELRKIREDETEKRRAIDRVNHGYSAGTGFRGECDEQKKHQVRGVLARLRDGLKILLDN
jgi:hypothetical protein